AWGRGPRVVSPGRPRGPPGEHPAGDPPPPPAGTPTPLAPGTGGPPEPDEGSSKFTTRTPLSVRRSWIAASVSGSDCIASSGYTTLAAPLEVSDAAECAVLLVTRTCTLNGWVAALLGISNARTKAAHCVGSKNGTVPPAMKFALRRPAARGIAGQPRSPRSTAPSTSCPCASIGEAWPSTPCRKIRPWML